MRGLMRVAGGMAELVYCTLLCHTSWYKRNAHISDEYLAKKELFTKHKHKPKTPFFLSLFPFFLLWSRFRFPCAKIKKRGRRPLLPTTAKKV